MGELTITLGDAIQAGIFICGLLLAYFKQKDIMEDNHSALVKEMQIISLNNSEAHSERKAEIQSARVHATTINTDTKEVLRAETNEIKSELANKYTDIDKRVTLLEVKRS